MSKKTAGPRTTHGQSSQGRKTSEALTKELKEHFGSIEQKEVLEETSPQVTEEIRYSDEMLAKFGGLLDAKLKAERYNLELLQSRLKDALDDAENLGSSIRISESMESGEGTEADGYPAELLGSINRQQEFITKLERAQVRVARKTYGICDSCPVPHLINPARLEKVLHATKCVPAKMFQAA